MVDGRRMMVIVGENYGMGGTWHEGCRRQGLLSGLIGGFAVGRDLVNMDVSRIETTAEMTVHLLACPVGTGHTVYARHVFLPHA
jgi:hypothetical protein